MELLFESRLDIRGVEGHLTWVYGRPEIVPEPVLVPDTFADGAGASIYGTVLRDGGRLRMWYQAWPRDWVGYDVHHVGYAESEDGFAWHKPTLGLVECGPVPNHLCDLGFHSPSVFIDPEAAAGSRYRATGFVRPGRIGANPSAGEQGYYSAHSADGIHWTLDGASPTWPGGDVINSIYHPLQRRAVVSLKHTPRVGGMQRRSVWQAERCDGIWSLATMAMLPDGYDDVCAQARGFASGDYYGMAMMPAGSATVGFLWHFRHRLPRTPGRETGVFGVVDVGLAYQASPGDRWVQPHGREDWLTHDTVPWTAGGIYTSSSPLDVGEEEWLYLCGTSRPHGWYLSETWQRQDRRVQQLAGEGLARIGLARWRRDRLFGYKAEPEGVLELDLGTSDQPRGLYLNIEAGARGSVRVALLDQDGYSLDEAVALTGDQVRGHVRWRGTPWLPATPGGSLTARVYLDDATVYAFGVSSAG
jgi:hypothetical protein